MNKTVWRPFAILGLWSCLSTQLLLAAPASAQESGIKPKGTPLTVDINDLLQHWVHSREEQADGTGQIFRPAAWKKLPPSRFRMAYRFASDGGCGILVLSPNDEHYFKPCKWTTGANDRTILQIIADGSTQSFKILELSGKILRLTPLKPEQHK